MTKEDQEGQRDAFARDKRKSGFAKMRETERERESMAPKGLFCCNGMATISQCRKKRLEGGARLST